MAPDGEAQVKVMLRNLRPLIKGLSYYEQCGFVRLPETAPHTAFTRALNVQHRDVLLYHKQLDPA